MGSFQKANHLAWRLKRETSAICEPSRVRLARIFFSEICVSWASTLAKKNPAKPQSTKTANSTGYSMQNKVGPS